MRPTPNRQPMGIPIGGQYATAVHPEAGIALSHVRNRLTMAERRELLKAGGFIPAATLVAASEPTTTAAREEWWNRNFIAAEYGADASKSFPQMPDDYTPGMTDGLAMSGKRRTHRMNYGNKDIQLRMPSATAIKRYSSKKGNPTFDVPVSVAIKGGEPKMTWVRVTKTGPHSWEASRLGGAADTQASIMVAEAVAAVLESRRPSMALHGVEDLLKANRKREAAKGAELSPINSTFIEEVGYDAATSTMATRIGDKLYGHRVNAETFAMLKNSERPGTVFNRLIRQVPGAGVERCESCGRFGNTRVTHVCPKGHKEGSGLDADHSQRARSRAEMIATNRSRGVDPALAANVVPAPAPVRTTPAPGAPPVPATKTGPPARRRAGVPAPGRPAKPAHLENPIMDNRVYRREVDALRTSAAAGGFSVLGNGPERRAEVSVNTGAFLARIDVGTDGSLQRSIDNAQVDTFPEGPALDMEKWAAENALAMARVTDAERRRRPAPAGSTS